MIEKTQLTPFHISRRRFLHAAAAGGLGIATGAAFAQEPGERPSRADRVKVLNPRNRVPMSFIIDDSTCLVNLAHFGIPQFAEAFPSQYQQDWRKLPREIPDAFVREFGDWCRDHGVKGKYSVVPNPACVGWVDQNLPGWSKRDLENSVKLVREELTPNWDIHPEMITHTWVINTKTGRPFAERSEAFMENFGWSQDKSVDVLADYMSYALRILKNAGLLCEGITTPGGFGSRNRDNLAQATLESCRDVYQAEIPHYFRDLFGSGDQSVAPRVELASGLGGSDPQCVVSIVGCTGDWFGGWDGLTPGSVDRFITEDLQEGRLPQVIDRGEPAILVCHWPGIYYNGEKLGLRIFQEVVRRVHARYDNLVWMKLSEIARYWAAKELTHFDIDGSQVTLHAPFATPAFTVDLAHPGARKTELTVEGQTRPLQEVSRALDLVSGTFHRREDGLTVCFDLPKGTTLLETA